MSETKPAWELLGVEKYQLPLLLPNSYRDYRCVVSDFSCLPQMVGCTVVVTGYCVLQGWISGPKPRVSIQVFDQQGASLSISLFASSDEAALLPHEAHGAFYGEVFADFHGRCYLNSAQPAPMDLLGRVVPVYPAIKGKISRDGVFALISSNLKACLPDCLAWLRGRVADIPVGKMREAIECRTWTFDQLIRAAHWPTSVRQGEVAVQVLERTAAFVEAYRLTHAPKEPKPLGRPVPNAGFKDIPARCPFPLTGEQIAVATEILAACNQAEPSQNLLLGDVGYGKSYVIALVVAAVVRGGGRVAVMLPSKILVNQMHELFVALMPELNAQLLTEDAVNGGEDHPLWVGTTGLLHREWPHPWDLVVVDEQQRFSVAQRQSLGSGHLLEATATPICRTMALARWGADINLFRLTQCPVERTIESRVLMHEHRLELMDRVMQTLSTGGQVLVVCPRKDESKPSRGKKKFEQDTKDEQASVEGVVSDFKRILPVMAQKLGFSPEIVFATGARSEEENEAALNDMRARKAHILVATTVVETGVTIHGLSHVVVYHADRLGAVQLHQLRGRLVRAGGHGLFDLYLPTPPSPTTLKRMGIMTSCTQGYDVAMADLRLRGCGDLLSGASQSGAGESLLPRRPINIDHLERFVAML